MAEKTLYTALGHFRCRNDGGGRRYPVILMDHREFGMDPQEMTIWTALCWRLTDRQRAEDFYEQLSNGMQLFPRRSFSDCLDRLVTRGLVAKGSGTTDFDALYDLLGELYVVPISSSFPLKVVTFLKLLRSGTAPGSAAALFRRDRRTEPERRVMALSGHTPLSTAELVRCAECDISAAVGSQQTLALLYGDQETTSDNIVFSDISPKDTEMFEWAWSFRDVFLRFACQPEDDLEPSFYFHEEERYRAAGARLCVTFCGLNGYRSIP